MRFMTMVKSKENGAIPPKELMDAIIRLGMDAGPALIATGGLLPSAAGARVRLAGGEISVVDGPFTEARELVGGYAIYEVKTKAEAIEFTRRFSASARCFCGGRRPGSPDRFP